MFYSLKLWSFGFIYVITFLIITFICPALLVKLQVYKNTIHGPWDEAIIKY
jgi:phosphatidylinositol glycan class C protein